MKGCPFKQLFDIHVRGGGNINLIKNDQNRDSGK
jgi:hypothetical protein